MAELTILGILGLILAGLMLYFRVFSTRSILIVGGIAVAMLSFGQILSNPLLIGALVIIMAFFAIKRR